MIMISFFQCICTAFIWYGGCVIFGSLSLFQCTWHGGYGISYLFCMVTDMVIGTMFDDFVQLELLNKLLTSYIEFLTRIARDLGLYQYSR